MDAICTAAAIINAAEVASRYVGYTASVGYGVSAIRSLQSYTGSVITSMIIHYYILHIPYLLP